MNDPTKKVLTPDEQAIEERAKTLGITRAAAAAQIAHEKRQAAVPSQPPAAAEAAPAEPRAKPPRRSGAKA
jgi:hypothetical protein